MKIQTATEASDRSPSAETERQSALALAWLLPQSQVCAVYSIPMGVLESFVVKVGAWVVGNAGAWPASVYLRNLREKKIVQAPCRLRPFISPDRTPSPVLTEALSRTPSLQGLELALGMGVESEHELGMAA